MKKDFLNIYFTKRFNAIDKCIIAYKQYQNPEDLHRLRVNIKKIKALISFIEDVFDEKHKSQELKALFQKAGAIRELQINIHLLNLIPQFPKRFITHLKKEEDNLSQQFLKHTPRYLKSISQFRNDLSLPQRLPAKKSLQTYFKKQLKKANKKLQNKNRENTHRYRTKIKNMLYVYNSLPKKLQENIKLDGEVLTEQQKKVGQWHDLYSAINFLSKQSFAPEIAEHLSKLKRKEGKLFSALPRKS